jgi:hypothetical protein
MQLLHYVSCNPGFFEAVLKVVGMRYTGNEPGLEQHHLMIEAAGLETHPLI